MCNINGATQAMLMQQRASHESAKVNRAQRLETAKDQDEKKADALNKRFGAGDHQASATKKKNNTKAVGSSMAMIGAICCCVPGIGWAVGGCIAAAGAIVVVAGELSAQGDSKEAEKLQLEATKQEMEADKLDGDIKDTEKSEADDRETRAQAMQAALATRREYDKAVNASIR